MITVEDIRNCTDDDELYNLIASEMSNLMGDFESDDNDVYIEKIKSLPKCFWALGAIYELDVSVTLDDLGWHFGNHYSWGLAQETLKSLKEINAKEEAEIFEQTIKIVKKYWLALGKALSDKNEEFSD